MKPPASNQPDRLIRWMASLGDPARLRILRLLDRHELGVAELSDILQLPQSTISRHLKMLADDEWIDSRRVGTSHLSSLRKELDPAQARLWQLSHERVAEWASSRQDEARLQRRLRDRQDDARRFFTGAAGEWDAIRAQLYGSDFTWHAIAALLPDDAVVADLGCGTGQLIEAIAPAVGRAIGVDNTPAMLEAAAARLRGVENIELLQGELESLPIDDSAVDAAVMVLALSYVAEPVACAKEVARILKPGGRGVIIDLAAHDREDFRAQMGQSRLGFEGEELVGMLGQVGLHDVRVRMLPPAANVRGPNLFVATAMKPGARRP